MAITRFQDVTQAALDVVLGGLEEPTNGYRSFFPERFTTNLTWESLSADGNMAVAADVVSHDASVKLKARPDTALVTGEIPKIGLLNKVTEKQLHNLYALQNNPRGREQEIFNIIFGDVARVYRGVHARMEMLAMQALSTGVAATTASDNIGITFQATYGIPAGNKTGTQGAIWTTAATATPIADLKHVVRMARDAGYIIQRIVMDQASLDNMLATDEVKSMYSGVMGLSAALLVPTEAQINTLLTNQGLPQMVVVDPSVAREAADGTITVSNPWSSGKIAFLTNPTPGSTQYTLTAEEKMSGYSSPTALASNRDIVRVSRYDEKNPFRVFTKGEAVAFPVLDNPKGIFLLNTLNATTWA